jgi:DNA-binding response OmpR family regulator
MELIRIAKEEKMKHILLVEDTKEVYQMVSESVSGMGVLHWAKSITEATDLISKNIYNLLILDIGLPDGNGIDLCRNIQRTHPKLPVFFLTGHNNLTEKSNAFTSGADSYITKPFTPKELRDRILSFDETQENMELLGMFLKLK